MPPLDGLKPIYSSLEHDPGAGETIETFIVGLAERVDVLQDTQRLGELEQLHALCDTLIADAVGAGFESLADLGRSLQDACRAGDGDAVRERLCRLTDEAQCARLGHRGAV
jgi:hypothetical protein